MTTSLDSAKDLLDAAYSDLDFVSGDLLQATDAPGELDRADWITRGGWLSLADTLNADRIFFVEDNPVIVFFKDQPGTEDLRQLFNRAWCMARPPLLFVAQPGMLSVFDLTQPPAREDDDPFPSGRLLKFAHQAAEVQEKLQDFHRAQIESGRLFEERQFGFENRADHALIRDLASVRTKLLDGGLSIPHAHTLIGRSIFIRYLEDRRILIEDYFREVAGEKKEWHSILDDARMHPAARDERRLYYAAILSDKGFTDALFSRLAEEFNGDLFPFDADEQEAFSVPHLKLMREFLLCEIEGPTLFTFAYDFEIIPIELISSMYEEFLRTKKGKQNTHASFYTPGALVEFVLSQTLTEKVLAGRPRIMDAACGSASFLVDAFRRLVRHRVCERGQRLRPDELRKILREQIAGIDVQPEAIRVAAFSLYLAFLHYLDPSDIRGHRLPHLIYSPDREETDPKQHFDILVAANAFDVKAKVKEEPIQKRFSSNCADVVVGNPPWGSPEKEKEDAEAWEAATIAMKWCQGRVKSVGDRELSQAFIHLTHDLLRDDGRSGLLVSTGVFFKRQDKSQKFREQWLAASVLEDVVNFAAVRDVFFKKANAPFASVVFEKRKPRGRTHRFRYYSAKRTAFVEGLEIVRLSKPDLHVVRQSDFVADDELWKVYWWGGHRDEALVRALRLESTLGSVIDPDAAHPEYIAKGYERPGSDREPMPCPWLSQYDALPHSAFERYGDIRASVFEPPPTHLRRRSGQNTTIFDGLRLLIGRSPRQRDGANGRVIARLESRPFCFSDSIHGLRLVDNDEAKGKLLLGIVWSSLNRYFLWMTSGHWGMWHFEIKRELIKRIPVRLPRSRAMRDRVVAIVERLRALDTAPMNLLAKKGTRVSPTTKSEIGMLEEELDDAIFDLYELTDAERDVVRDMCGFGLELFYRKTKSDAVKTVEGLANRPRIGRRGDLPKERAEQCGLDGYLDAFLEVWDAELGPGGQFRWRVICPSKSSPMLAVVFSTEDTGDLLEATTESDDTAWRNLLDRLAASSSHPFGSKRIYIDGMTRIVGENDIAIIKRNERRLWTRTAAREDAEATQLKAAHEQRAFAGERAV